MQLMPLVASKSNGPPGDGRGLRTLQTCFGWSVCLERAWYHSNWRSHANLNGHQRPREAEEAWKRCASNTTPLTFVMCCKIHFITWVWPGRFVKCKDQMSSGSGGTNWIFASGRHNWQLSITPLTSTVCILFRNGGFSCKLRRYWLLRSEQLCCGDQQHAISFWSAGKTLFVIRHLTFNPKRNFNSREVQ